MISVSKLIEGTLIVLLLLLVVIDAGMYAYIRNNYSEEPPQFIYRVHDRVSSPDGFTLDGTKIAADTLQRAGWAIQYAARGCNSCRLEEPLWNSLKSSLHEAGYRVFVVPPDVQASYPIGSHELEGVEQDVYVNIGWLQDFRLTVTPTLLVFNSNGRLIWVHEGALDQSDKTSLIRAISPRHSLFRWMGRN